MEGFWRVNSTSRKVARKPSARKSCADRPHVEKHPLWSRRHGTLDGHKSIACVPADPIPIGVCNDAATANFIGHAQADSERFRNQRMAKSPACESPIHGEPR